jgi:thiamine biosynthesis lipoprotein
MRQPSAVARRLAALEDLGFTRADETPVTTEAVRVDRTTEKVIATRPAMGTLVSVTAVTDTRARAEEAIGRAFDEMDRLIAIFSRFDANSALTRLNDAGGITGQPPELEHMVARALRYHETTGGAFDLTVAPLLELFRRRFEGPVPTEPTDAEIREALELVGPDGVRLGDRRMTFARSGMAITLDGIAKGYIVDAVADRLQRHGVKRYLVNAGGDIRTRGTSADRRPWRVAVRHPSDDEVFPDVIDVKRAAVATSGSYEIYFDRERRFHHIVNARTGRSPDVCAGVTVVAPSTMAADVLATAAFVLGPEGGRGLIERLSGVECVIVTRDGRRVTSRGWKSAGPLSATEGEA